MNNGNDPINGLMLKKISSQSFPVSAFDDLDNKQMSTVLDEINQKTPLSFIRRGVGGEVSFVVAYLDYKVLIGKFTNGSFSFFNNETIEPKYIQRIRIFNKNEELLLWRSEGILKGRYRKDDDGVEVWAVDNYQVLFGTNYPKNNPPGSDSTTIIEDRGTEINLPFEVKNIDVSNKNRVKIKTRNYIGFNEVFQATYTDNRFVEFTFGENNNPLEVEL
jgi:CRISPR-associated protein (TIGR03984 family)